MLYACQRLFENWEKEGVFYCHWKSNEHLSEGLNGLTDLDIYVSPNCKEKAEDVLIEQNYIKFRPQKGARYPFVDEWIGFDEETAKLIHVHLHYQIITGTKYNKEYILPIDNLLLTSRKIDELENVYVICPELEIIILYVRIVLKAKNKKHIIIGEDYKKEIVYLKNLIDKKSLHEYCNKLFNKNCDYIYTYLQKDSLSEKELYELYRQFKSWLRRCRKFTKATVWLRYKYYKTRNLIVAVFNKKFKKNKITRKTLYGRGLSICFVGADGCGKSTISSQIQKWLNWKVEAKRFYLGSGDHYNSFLKKLTGKIYRKKASTSELSSTKKQESKSTGAKVSLKRRIQRYLFAYIKSCNFKRIAKKTYKELKKADKYVSNGAIAIYDRFPQIQFSGIYDGPKIAERCVPLNKGLIVNAMAKQEKKLLTKAQKHQPDLVFKLLISAEEAVRRKPDHSIKEVSTKVELTEKIVFEKSKVYKINAEQDYAEEIKEIKRIIWRNLLNDGN